MKQFFQRIKAWYAAHCIGRPAKGCQRVSGENPGGMDWAGRDVTFSQEFWLRSNGLK